MEPSALQEDLPTDHQNTLDKNPASANVDNDTDNQNLKEITEPALANSDGFPEPPKSESLPLIQSPYVTTPPYEYIVLTKENEGKIRIFLNPHIDHTFRLELAKNLQDCSHKVENLPPEPPTSTSISLQTRSVSSKSIKSLKSTLSSRSDFSGSRSILPLPHNSSDTHILHCFDPSEVDVDLKKMLKEKPPITQNIVRRKPRIERGSSVPAIDSYYGTQDLDKVGHASYFIPDLTASERRAIGWNKNYSYGKWKYSTSKITGHGTSDNVGDVRSVSKVKFRDQNVQDSSRIFIISTGSTLEQNEDDKFQNSEKISELKQEEKSPPQSCLIGLRDKTSALKRFKKWLVSCIKFKRNKKKIDISPSPSGCSYECVHIKTAVPTDHNNGSPSQVSQIYGSGSPNSPNQIKTLGSHSVLNNHHHHHDKIRFFHHKPPKTDVVGGDVLMSSDNNVSSIFKAMSSIPNVQPHSEIGPTIHIESPEVHKDAKILAPDLVQQGPGQPTKPPDTQESVTQPLESQPSRPINNNNPENTSKPFLTPLHLESKVACPQELTVQMMPSIIPPPKIHLPSYSFYAPSHEIDEMLGKFTDPQHDPYLEEDYPDNFDNYYSNGGCSGLDRFDNDAESIPETRFLDAKDLVVNRQRYHNDNDYQAEYDDDDGDDYDDYYYEFEDEVGTSYSEDYDYNSNNEVEDCVPQNSENQSTKGNYANHNNGNISIVEGPVPDGSGLQVTSVNNQNNS